MLHLTTPDGHDARLAAAPARLLLATLCFSASACALVAPYDPIFDESLNGFSSETAVFTASAAAGGPQASAVSQEAVAYYASASNLLDRLSARAQLSRATVPCPTNAGLPLLAELPTIQNPLPDDYMSYDCREFQLASVRLYLVQLQNGHRSDGVLKPGEARAYGGQLQIAITGAINTFALTKGRI
jgi:hypothetical protein